MKDPRETLARGSRSLPRTAAALVPVVLALAVVSPLKAEPPASPPPGLVLVSTNQLASMEREGSALRHENALLRKENRALRRQLVKRNQDASSKATDGPAVQEAKGPGNGYWLSPSGKRHNSRCRFFRQGNGEPCGKDDGTPCRICGG